MSLAISSSYFLLHLLYYLLLAARLVEEREERGRWSLLLGTSVWVVVRPMLALVGLGWHLLAPLAALLLDARLRHEWPASVLLRPAAAADTIALEGVGEDKAEVSTTEISPNFSVLMLENREFHNPSFPIH